MVFQRKPTRKGLTDNYKVIAYNALIVLNFNKIQLIAKYAFNKVHEQHGINTDFLLWGKIRFMSSCL